jgi:hypothetical protein
MYIYSAQLRSTAATPGAATPMDTVNLTGVQNDLLGIARAEREFNAEQGHFGSLDELVSGKFITIKGSRPPYSYAVETSSDNFRVTATRTTPGSPSQLWIDDTMEMHTTQ